MPAVSIETPELDDIREAHSRIEPHIHRTPILSSSYLNTQSGAQLYFKCENFQKTGAFKARGACNVVFGLEKSVRKRGVITHSSGNHAAALSYAAALTDTPCQIVMPTTASRAKQAAVKHYGGEIISCEPSISSREDTVSKIVEKTGAEFVHPYNDVRVITGQATCALELIEDAPSMDILVAPLGGGGLISGSLLSALYLDSSIKVIGAVPDQADDAYRSLQSGNLVSDDAPLTVADGLKVPMRETTWHFVSKYLGEIITVSEQEIIDAMKLIWERMKIIIEPSCAVPLAAILKNPDQFRNKKVGVILTGGNVDLNALPWL